MNPILKALNEQLSALEAESLALLSKPERTPEDKARVLALPSEIAAVKADRDAELALVEAGRAARVAAAEAATPLNAGTPPEEKKPADVVVKYRAHNLQNIGEAISDRKKAELTAYQIGMFLLHSTGKRPNATKYCMDNGLLAAGHIESLNESGGALVFPEFENVLIVLREKYGIFREYARKTGMGSDQKSRPRRQGGLTAYFEGEEDQALDSKAKWDNVKLNAKKLMINAKVSNELNEDAVIDMADTLSGEIAYAFAKKEDQCGFVGDGTSTYGEIVGVTSKLKNKWGVAPSTGDGLVLGSGNAMTELTRQDFEKVVAALPVFAMDRAKWFMNPVVFFTVVQELILAAGGVTAESVQNGVAKRFLGFDVVLTPAMPYTDANSQVIAFLGDLALAADFGDRRQTTVALSDAPYFTTDELAIRGTERFDINVHSVEAPTADSPGGRGPVVGLITAAS